MKTRIIILMAMAVVAAGLTSCEKSETKTLKITAKALRSADKATMNGTRIMWEEGDEIKINDVPQTVAIVNNNFNVTAGDPETDGGYYAVFPSNIAYSYNEGRPYFTCNLGNLFYTNTKVSAPMFACCPRDGNTLTFSTPYALLALNLTNGTGSQLSLSNLTITLSGSNIGNERSISFVGTNTNTSIIDPGVETDNLNYNISCNIPAESSTTLYIPIPPSTGASMEFSFNTGEYSLSGETDFNFVGGTIYRIYLNLE